MKVMSAGPPSLLLRRYQVFPRTTAGFAAFRVFTMVQLGVPAGLIATPAQAAWFAV